MFANLLFLLYHICAIDKIYITGGFDGHDCMNTAEVYDPSTNQWTMITAMRSRRSGVSCISYHGCVYVIGIKTCTYYKRNVIMVFVLFMLKRLTYTREN